MLAVKTHDVLSCRPFPLVGNNSHALNFYWMFVALIAGVCSFGVPGVVIGPIVVGGLKAVFDTITPDPATGWRQPKGACRMTGFMEHVYQCIGHMLKIPDIVDSRGVYLFDGDGKRHSITNPYSRPPMRASAPGGKSSAS